MAWVVELIIALAAMPVVGCALIGAWRGAQRLAEARRRPLAPEPLDRLEADLRRLRAELEDTETRAGLTAKNHRVQALRGAYLDVLAVACHRMDVPPPRGGDQARLAEVYRAEEALRHRGLHVRQPTAH